MECQWCGQRLQSLARAGRLPKYCSTRCRMAAFRHRGVTPEPLVLRSRWIRWDDTTGSKVPVTKTNRPMNALDQRNWRAFDDLANEPRRGFVLNGDGIVCVDVDDCLTPNGKPKPWAKRLLKLFPDTWVEISPSGRGLHIWGVADFPATHFATYYGHRIEIYGDRRFITVTNNPLPRCATHLADIQTPIDRFTDGQ